MRHEVTLNFSREELSFKKSSHVLRSMLRELLTSLLVENFADVLKAVVFTDGVERVLYLILATTFLHSSFKALDQGCVTDAVIKDFIAFTSVDKRLHMRGTLTSNANQGMNVRLHS